MFIQKLTNSLFDLNPAWRIHPPPSIITHQPTVSDNLIDCLKDGSITSVMGIYRFSGPHEVELHDGTRLEIDAVISCTGYAADFSLIPDLLPPNMSGNSTPRLYHNIFPPSRADSVAFLNSFNYPTGWFPLVDLASMAVAQIWAGRSTLPSVSVMNDSIDRHSTWVSSLSKKEPDTLPADIIHEKSWTRWLHEMAGTGVNENLGYGAKGWRFWLRNFGLNNLVMGFDTPIVLRLFDGKRKRWDGARDAIVRESECARTQMRDGVNLIHTPPVEG
jgi:dimethylaniline monooxygenase (N-oxide forming)